jgi:pimeloyl-ACP methyl ester carboxylesterase
MPDCTSVDYGPLDRPEILQHLFHPRPESPAAAPPEGSIDLTVPVAPGVSLGARLHPAGAAAATLLFFHGNGEIVADYDDLGPLYARLGINFLAVDYRGYGRSDGRPTVSAMMADAQAVLAFVRDYLKGRGWSGPLLAMGRSLGSASALALAAGHGDAVAGLIVESGFAYAEPLLGRLGVDTARIGAQNLRLFDNIDMMRAVRRPTLIIHAERDHIIPFSDARALFEASPAADKTLLPIPAANHNDIFFHGLEAYLQAVKELVERVAA